MTVLQVSLKLLHPAVFIILFDVIFTKNQKCISMTENIFILAQAARAFQSKLCPTWAGLFRYKK